MVRRVTCSDHGGRSDVSRCWACADEAAEEAREMETFEEEQRAKLARAVALLKEAVDILPDGIDACDLAIRALESATRSLAAYRR
jgi:hypothetical protein